MTAPRAAPLSTLLASCALLACGGRTPLDGLAGLEPQGGADAAVVDASALDAPRALDADAPVGPPDASVEAAATCNPTLPPPPPGCYLPSGRPCLDGSCMCDDECNFCTCLDGGGFTETDIGCPPFGSTVACKGPLSERCVSSRVDDVCFDPAKPVAYYCGRPLLDACGNSVCPSLDCTFDHTDQQNGGTYWCCPH